MLALQLDDQALFLERWRGIVVGRVDPASSGARSPASGATHAGGAMGRTGRRRFGGVSDGALPSAYSWPNKCFSLW